MTKDVLHIYIKSIFIFNYSNSLQTFNENYLFINNNKIAKINIKRFHIVYLDIIDKGFFIEDFIQLVKKEDHLINFFIIKLIQY